MERNFAVSEVTDILKGLDGTKRRIKKITTDILYQSVIDYGEFKGKTIKFIFDMEIEPSQIPNIPQTPPEPLIRTKEPEPLQHYVNHIQSCIK